jgi:hypothetical protein
MGGSSGAVLRPMGDDRRVDSRMTGVSLMGRLLLISVVALGLVGMHHLVAAGCAQLGITAGSHGGHGQPGAGGMPVTPAMQGSAVSAAVVSVPVSAPVGHTPMSGGATDAAITCLAVLMLIVLLRPPGVLGLLHRIFGRWRVAAAAWVQRTVEPPDLIQLSISRT